MMRFFPTVLALLILATVALAQTYPPLTGRVSDHADLLPQATRAALTAKLQALEDKSGIQLVVATVPSLQDQDIEDYANGLFRAWKLGEAKKNNGALFLIAPKERKMRIEVGYGLEGALTDAVSKIIIATAVAPRFKAGDFAGGVERGVDAIIETLSSDKSEWTERARKPRTDAIDDIAPLILFALFLFILFSMARASRGPRHYGGYPRGGGRGPVIFLPPSDSWGDGGWGGGGGGDFGGGGFSGGGGSSGGGGASGDW